MFDSGVKKKSKDINLEAEKKEKKRDLANYIASLFSRQEATIKRIQKEIAQLDADKENKIREYDKYFKKTSESIEFEIKTLEKIVEKKRNDLDILTVEVKEMENRLVNEKDLYKDRLNDLSERIEATKEEKNKWQEASKSLNKQEEDISILQNNINVQNELLGEKEKNIKRQEVESTTRIDKQIEELEIRKESFEIDSDIVLQDRKQLDIDIDDFKKKQQEANLVVAKLDDVLRRENLLIQGKKDQNKRAEYLKTLREEANQIIIVKRNQAAKEAELNRREKELVKREAVVAK